MGLYACNHTAGEVQAEASGYVGLCFDKPEANKQAQKENSWKGRGSDRTDVGRKVQTFWVE